MFVAKKVSSFNYIIIPIHISLSWSSFCFKHLSFSINMIYSLCPTDLLISRLSNYTTIKHCLIIISSFAWHLCSKIYHSPDWLHLIYNYNHLLISQTTSHSHTYLEEGAWTDQPKSAIFSSPPTPSNRFSGLMSRWMTFFEWQYIKASVSWNIY